MPQEIEVYYIIPAIRREMALALKALGRKQKDIADVLCVKESTISQYFSGKRAGDVLLNDAVISAVKGAVGRIRDRASFVGEVQRIVGIVKAQKLMCSIHIQKGGMPKACNVCFR